MLTGFVLEWILPLTALLAIGRLLMPGSLRFLQEHGITERNYTGDSIPTAGGLLIWLLLLASFVIDNFTGIWNPDAVWVLSLSIICFAGFLDDVKGDKRTKGIRGHWLAWKRERSITTGILKAAAAGLAGLLVLLPDQDSLWDLPRQLLLVLLATNGVNLFDVRPGRALKMFFFFMGMIGWSSFLMAADAAPGGAQLWHDLAPVLVGALLLAPLDLKGRIMLGDTGANLLGFALGIGIVRLTTELFQGAVLAVFVALHMLTWRRSLSSLIETNRFLRWLDGAGRERV
ncbi:hypothetical protein EXW96_08560 [Paenibacillus sp. JMULE4]|uniref:hypothetical protein n=1 Tax=Paenibacillus sp. JMULE4 TaxID=2518342 RepID=UPI0015758AA9|nr:hypothetical protein [Paenibacillus sp. JMULE4]NTZ17618.1 hypothetical protein [Paenibacillus sp. JMULE4]